MVSYGSGVKKITQAQGKPGRKLLNKKQAIFAIIGSHYRIGKSKKIIERKMDLTEM